jgi:chitin disaccharide deacetylase
MFKSTPNEAVTLAGTIESVTHTNLANKPAPLTRGPRQAGVLILNADDWGRNTATTDRTLECVNRAAVSSVSAMVFMEDSERAAALAQDRGVDAGLHLNFTTPFSAAATGQLEEHHRRVSGFLLRNRLARVLYHPGLAGSFEYVVAAQVAEYVRLYGVEPHRVDGHHHMHLCANVLFGGLLPKGTIARRNFSFQAEEKSRVNRLYRGLVDRVLARRHRLTDFFFSLPPLQPAERLERMFSLAYEFVVEVETHPVNPEEHRFLLTGEIFERAGNITIASRYNLPERVGDGRQATS